MKHKRIRIAGVLFSDDGFELHRYYFNQFSNIDFKQRFFMHELNENFITQKYTNKTLQAILNRKLLGVIE